VSNERTVAFDALMSALVPVLSEHGFRRVRRKFLRERDGVSQTLLFRSGRSAMPEVVQVDKDLDVFCKFDDKEVTLILNFSQFPCWPDVDPSGIYEPFNDVTVASAADFHIDWLKTFFFLLADRLLEPDAIDLERNGLRDGYLMSRSETRPEN
jgi:hypothetical protein